MTSCRRGPAFLPDAAKGDAGMPRLEGGVAFPRLPGLSPVNAEIGRQPFLLYFFPKAFTGG